MMGYLKNEKATLEVMDEEGYFRTGDQGKFDGKFLKITGRIKELIITAGGENVAPVPMKTFSRWSAHLAVTSCLLESSKDSWGL